MSQTCAWRRALKIPEEVKTTPFNATQILRFNQKNQGIQHLETHPKKE